MFKFIFIFSILALFGCSSATVQTAEAPRILKSAAACEEGAIRRGFTNSVTTGDIPCFEGTQTCLAGDWVGPLLYDSCENHTKSCDGSPHGSVINGYLQPTSPKGFPCTIATKTCLNGAWLGPEVFESCTEF